MSLKVANIKLPLGESEDALPERIAERLGVARDGISRWRILRKSLDARRHEDIHFLYSAEVEVPEGESSLAERLGPQVATYAPERFDWPEPGSAPLEHRPVVVGAGPAGLFAAYCLAKDGYAPLVLERGKDVKDRVADVRSFDKGGEFDPESNYLYGEGGAGTFSDGKLTCRGSGPDFLRALEILAECHAKPSVVYEHRPHLGSNRLPLIVRTLRKKIEQLGGEVRFSSRLDDLEIRDGKVAGLTANSGAIPAEAVVLAIGHSARDTYAMLLDRGVPLEFKPFQFGVRIEQPQAGINEARFGPAAATLGAADYQLVAHAGSRDLFTFCMCAGGYVMPSVSEAGFFCTNGMSESYHDSPFANSGLVVTIGRGDVGSDHPLAGVKFQQRFERQAFFVGKQSYAAPIQRASDFFAGRPSSGTVPSSYPRGVVPGSLDSFLPPVVLAALERGLPIMDRQLRRHFLRDATLVGPESRGSSPVRIPRGDLSRECPKIVGLYPCGEGAGYAGGIVSAAVDGLRTARAIVARYARPAGG